jgi:predicted deacylase
LLLEKKSHSLKRNLRKNLSELLQKRRVLRRRYRRKTMSKFARTTNRKASRVSTTLAKWVSLVFILSIGLANDAALAQFDPAKVYVEPEAIAKQFPDPDVRYDTPSLREGRRDFASHAEVVEFALTLEKASPHVRVETIGRSQKELPMPMIVFARNGVIDAARPVILIIAQQHGNEPASGEAALAIAHTLAHARSALLKNVTVLIIPRANPDGAERFARATVNGIDVNRDHVLLRTPEGQAIGQVMTKYRPHVVLDLHEFTVGGRWIEKFGVVQRYDALIQSTSVGNMDSALSEFAEREFAAPVQRAWRAAKLAGFHYHTTSPSAADKVVSMGGVQPDTGRNVAGLRPAVSLLIEVRGVGLGRAHLLRRVHTQVIAALSVLEAAGALGQRLSNAVADAGARVQARACKGEVVIAAQHSPEQKTLEFLDVKTAQPREIEVPWMSAFKLDVKRTRSNACGYLIDASQTQTLSRLSMLGVRSHTLVQAGEWTVERYAVKATSAGRRQDARGAIDDGGGAIDVVEVETQTVTLAIAPGMVYVPLDQPLAALIVAALEPDSQSSFAANKLLDIGQDKLLRVQLVPTKRW